MCWQPWFERMGLTLSLPSPINERQQSVNNFWSYIMDNQWAMQLPQPIIIVFSTIMGKNATDNHTTTGWQYDSTEHQQFLVLHLG